MVAAHDPLSDLDRAWGGPGDVAVRRLTATSKMPCALRPPHPLASQTVRRWSEQLAAGTSDTLDALDALPARPMPATDPAAPCEELGQDWVVAIDGPDRTEVSDPDGFDGPTPRWVSAHNAPRQGDGVPHAGLVATARPDRDPTAIVGPLPSHGRAHRRRTAAMISAAIAGLVVAILWLAPGRGARQAEPPASPPAVAPPTYATPAAVVTKPAGKPAANHGHRAIAAKPASKPGVATPSRKAVAKTPATDRGAARGATSAPPPSAAVSLRRPAAQNAPRSQSATAKHKPAVHGAGPAAKKIAAVDPGTTKPAAVTAKRPATTR